MNRSRVRHCRNTLPLRRSIFIFGALTVVVLSGGCGSPDGRDAARETAEKAAGAFTPEDLPDTEPWDPKDGACRALVVGDSLVEATLEAQEGGFTYMGCESIVDGLASRSLSTGWQCLANGGSSIGIVLREEPEPGNTTCRPSGLELLEMWSQFTRAASVTVIALGTNDAGMFTEETWVKRWNRAVNLTEGPLVFVTVGAKPGDRWVDNAERYNSALRTWCPNEPRCTLAEWDKTAPARDPGSYTDHVHLTGQAGEMRAVFIAVAARRVAVPAPAGPSRWKAPTISLPPAPPSTTAATNPTSPLESTSPTVVQPTNPASATTTTTLPGSMPPTTEPVAPPATEPPSPTGP